MLTNTVSLTNPLSNRNNKKNIFYAKYSYTAAIIILIIILKFNDHNKRYRLSIRASSRHLGLHS